MKEPVSQKSASLFPLILIHEKTSREKTHACERILSRDRASIIATQSRSGM